MSNESSNAVLAVLATAPSVDVADAIGHALVGERLAACASVIEGVTSIFRWKGQVEREQEVLMVLKTTTAAVERLRARLVELHPYEVPEVLVLDVKEGHRPYLEWVLSEVGGDG